MKLSFKISVIVLLGIILGISAAIFLILPVTSRSPDLLKIFLIFVFAVIPPSFIVWFLIHSIVVKPILELNIISKVIASGNLSKRVKIKPIDEIGELSENFNTVINNLTSGMQNMAYALGKEKLREKELAANYLVLDKEKAKDDALLSSIGDAVIAIDTMQKIFLFNKAASMMTGLESRAVIGQQYNFILKFQNETNKKEADDFISLKFQNETNKKEADDFISIALRGEKVTEGTRIILQRRNGEMLPVLHTTSPIFDRERKISGVVVVLKDITKERELEKMKDGFISLASHELRAPMTAIKGLISMIFEGDYGNLGEGLKDPLSDIAKSTDRLIQLVNDILDVSRIEAGRTKITITEVSIPDLVTEVVKTIKLLADQKHINMEIKESTVGKINTDPDKFKQILINLVSNAIKFTDTGSVSISFRTSGKFAYISVTDSGIGISREDQQKLFEKFTQISFSQTGRPPGTGLGLYISREFARKMGGEMWIEHSEIGKGSTFTFALPLVNNVI